MLGRFSLPCVTEVIASVAACSGADGAPVGRLMGVHPDDFRVKGRGNDELRCSVDRVEALAQLFAGFEVRHGLARHGHLVAGARIAPKPRTTRASGEGTEAAQLNPCSSRQGRADLLEHRVHDPLDVAQVEMRVGGGQSLDQLGLAHAFALGCQAECAGRRRLVYLNS